MSERRYINQRTGEVVDDVEPRPFDQILKELGDGATLSELSEGFWDLVQRVQDTAKAGRITLTIHVAFNGKGQLETKDEVSLKLPEYNRPTTRFFLDNQGNATRRDPNQPELPEIASMKNKLKGIS